MIWLLPTLIFWLIAFIVPMAARNKRWMPAVFWAALWANSVCFTAFVCNIPYH